jgi:hypothetical protein
LPIAIFPRDKFNPSINPEYSVAKEFCLRAISISRKWVVKCLRKKGAPKGWAKDVLLRNYYPLILDENGFWTDSDNVRLDKELGIVYKSKEEI